MPRFSVFAAFNKADALDGLYGEVEATSPEAALRGRWDTLVPGERFGVLDHSADVLHMFKVTPSGKLKRAFAFRRAE